MIEFVYKFTRSIIRFISILFISLISEMIYIITFEKGTKGKITYRKAMRIKAITSFKIKLVEKMPNVMRYLGFYENLIRLKNRIVNGMQLRDTGTVKRAV